MEDKLKQLIEVQNEICKAIQDNIPPEEIEKKYHIKFEKPL